MGAFELHETTPLHAEPVMHHSHKHVIDESVIAMKIYDSCRNQNCLTPSEIGPARAAENVNTGDECLSEGDIIRPPANAASVSIDRLTVKRIIIVDKQPSPFKNGYWDVDIKYVFEYRLTFREVDGCVISIVKASNIFNMRVTLFGSVGSDLVVGTDMLTSLCESVTFDSKPFIWVEAKGIALHAKIHRSRHEEHDYVRHSHGHSHSHAEVHVTLGLFAIIKLFRLVDLNVQSKGFNVPDECAEGNPICPCEYFEELDFPMDVFTPPQKPEHLAGISHNIPKKNECT